MKWWYGHITGSEYQFPCNTFHQVKGITRGKKFLKFYFKHVRKYQTDTNSQTKLYLPNPAISRTPIK